MLDAVRVKPFAVNLAFSTTFFREPGHLAQQLRIQWLRGHKSARGDV